jgi:hypothetical protein
MITIAVMHAVISAETLKDRMEFLSTFPVEDLALMMLYLNDLYKDVRRAKASK